MDRRVRVEGEITADGRLLVDLPRGLPPGRVGVILEPLPEDDFELTEKALKGAGLTAEEIARSPEIGGWAGDDEAPSGAEYVDSIRHGARRYSW